MGKLNLTCFKRACVIITVNTMFKKMVLLIIVMALLATPTGCRNKADGTDINELISEHPAFNFGELNTYDLDDDGYVDNLVYSFETEEITEHLLLDRTVEYTENDDVFTGELT